MRRPGLLAVAAALVTTISVSVAPAAQAVPPAPSAPSLDLAPGMLDAMRRDLKLDDAQIAVRLRTESAAPVVEKRLRAKLGATFGGAWIPAGKTRLTVAVTDASQAALVREEGADATVVRRSEADLGRLRAALDRNDKKADRSVIHGWSVDTANNRVVVFAKPGAEARARAFAKDSGAGEVTVETMAAQPRPAHDIRGGDQYQTPGFYCSVGFSVVGGFVTAGHCGTTGTQTWGFNGVAQGNFAGSSFPDNDYGWVRTNNNWTPQPWVNNYSGGNVTVAGNQEAAIGSAVCRSGRTTGWRCGTIQAKNETVRYAEGTIYGMTRTSACVEGGDSGGAYVVGNQAQGVTSGTNAKCTGTPGSSWFQPLNEILSAYNLSLIVTGGNNGGGGGSTSSVINTWNNKCLDVPGGNFSDFVQLNMWTCNNLPPQKWTFVNGTLQAANNKCMDVPQGSSQNGVGIQLYACNGNPAQQWVLTAAGDLVNPQSNKCLDIRQWNANDGAALQLWDCSGQGNQKWRRG